MGDDFFNVHNRAYIIYDIFSQKNVIRVVDVGDVLDSSANDFPTYGIPRISKGDSLKFYALNSREYKGQYKISNVKIEANQSEISKAAKLYQVLNRSPYNAGLV